jgi:hypothetical protein
MRALSPRRDARPVGGARPALTLVLLVAIAGPARAQEAPLPVEALVAIVGAETPEEGTDLVLLSDVELRARLDLGPAGVSVRPSRPLLAATLDEIVGELLIAREATRLRATDPADVDVRAQRERLVQTLGGEAHVRALLASMHATEAELDVIARRRAYVDAFLRANLEGSTTVSDARVEEVFVSGEHPFASMTIEEAREPLRAWLAVRALADDVARWVAVLRQRTIVRVLVPLALPSPPDEAGAASEAPPTDAHEEREIDVAR